MSATDVVRKFGGQSPLARLLGINQSAIAYWVKQDTIPSKWHAQLIALAAPRGIPLRVAELAGQEMATLESTRPVKTLPPVVPDATEDRLATSKFLFYATGEDAVKVRVILGD